MRDVDNGRGYACVSKIKGYDNTMGWQKCGTIENLCWWYLWRFPPAPNYDLVISLLDI